MAGPVVHVLRGAPDETELAALVAVLSAIRAARPPEPEVPAPRPRRRVSFQAATSWRTSR
ncbi:acyl-CoA carboxylase subunit epsilon [Amycolatopsis sp.]|uniref:acyl-CoA carboxylase subunit epsilon n=1 Tax=Amycolatopsis sp. TaxID=37632 RepID=UPI002D80EFDC|nr:acyl-CoA carboxylase subunit epsilon [Amycolatopsis sp.]HET6707792.1 acyl-CoA carboxylase subunit epsilon [Amycolatopsis sp.]